MSKIFVIIVTYNGLKWIDKCLESLRNNKIEVQPVVIDNHSTDDTVKYIRANHQEVHLIESGENVGFGRANNIGLEYAIKNSCDYVFLLNQDAWINPDTIGHLVEIHKRNFEYGVLSPLHLSGDKKKLDYNFSCYISAHKCSNFVSDVILNRNELKEVYPIKFVNAALWLISRECLEIVGGFDPIFPLYGEDDDYIHRVYYHHLNIGVCPTVTAFHDREQEPSRLSKQPIETKIKRIYGHKLMSLKDINYQLSNRTLSVIKEIFVKFIDSLFKLDYRDIRIDLIILFKLLQNSRNISKSRKMSLKKGYSFLKI